jgi:hypothetical protein
MPVVLLLVVAAVAGAASGGAGLTAVAVASVEADVVLAGEEEGTETAVDLATVADSETEVAVVSEAVAAASEEAGMTLVHREVEVALGSCSTQSHGTSTD